MTVMIESASDETLQRSAASYSTRPKELLDLILSSLDDAKAESVVTIPLEGKSSVGDYLVIASGRSHRHVGAIAEHLAGDLKTGGFGKARVEGMPYCDWVLVDTGDVIIHLFRPEVRGFYNLEKMWSADFVERAVSA